MIISDFKYICMYSSYRIYIYIYIYEEFICKNRTQTDFQKDLKQIFYYVIMFVLCFIVLVNCFVFVFFNLVKITQLQFDWD